MRRGSINRQVSAEQGNTWRASRHGIMWDYSEALTCDALALLINGVVWRALSINGAAQPLRLLIGRGLDKLDGRLKDTELQSH